MTEEGDLTPAAYDAEYGEVALQSIRSDDKIHLVERSDATPELQVLSSAPNPFTDYTVTRFFAPESGVFTANLYGPEGRLIWSHSRPQFVGYGEVEITDREAPQPGVYFLELRGSFGRKTVRLVRN
jgi:hypothetical protein